MTRFSNFVGHTSPDGRPSNPFPTRIRTVACRNEDCGEDINEPVCPHCGTENEIEHEPDYEAGEREFDKYDH